MNEELIEVLDEFGNGTGIIKPKSEIKRDKDIHRAISICILNKNNEILAHKRSHKMKVYPDIWSFFVRGHVRAYEDSIDACIRETEEELGIILNKNDIRFLYTTSNIGSNNKYIENIFFDNYVINIDVNINELVLQDDEVSEVSIFNYKDLERMIKNNKEDIAPNDEDYKYIISMLKEIDNKNML